MAGSNKRPRPAGLSAELDRRVGRAIRDAVRESQTAAGGPLSASALVASARRTDAALQRYKDAQLEKSIERVLPGLRRLLRQEAGAADEARTDGSGSDNSEGSEPEPEPEPERDGSARFDALDGVPMMEVKDTNAMNGSLTRLWGARGGKGAGAGAGEQTQTQTQAQTQTQTQTQAQTQTQTQAPKGDGREPEPKRRRRRAKPADPSAHAAPEARLADLGGVDACIEEVLELIVMPLKHPEIYTHTGVEPPRGVLLHGPPGCGKTLLAHAIAGEVGLPFLQVSAPSVVSGMSGESEKKLREVFDEARALAPCIVFIDEIDAITPKRENAQREMERRIVAQMLTCIDGLSWDKTGHRPVMLIGATNRPDSLDPALRRAGRFDREISLGVPDEAAREQILRVLCQRLRLSGDVDIRELAKRTPGYVGADLTALTTAAGMTAVKRIFHSLQASGTAEEAMDVAGEAADAADGAADAASTPARWDAQPAADKLRTISGFLESHPEPLSPDELAPLAITHDDFVQALAKVQPSAKREGFATVPGVTWDDIGALGRVREELRMAVVEPIRNPDLFAQVGITAPAGVLLWGPPGNGKTLLAKAIANESHTNFISVKGGELMSKYVGDSERAVRQVFSRARASSPCVVFFDELDALCSRRSGEQSEASARVVNTLLTEIDGMEARKKVYVIAATNRPDIIDPAMLRPGRLDRLLYVELPTPPERAEILRTLTKRTPLAADVDLAAVAADSRCDGLSGADLAGLVREASVAALRSIVFASAPVAAPAPRRILVTREHFAAALARTTPSVSAPDMRRYEALRQVYGS
ncbi:Ribosome biogenesis ATPase rix7 [Coemansia javaensis]|uniref:Ribosome biogenesis ATPase rix7 n=1 Tax=Coemansia javaensis TaxID=2761396 RepID=A0A9W8H885_9FUNG|nr:Ribosome biogenesis ATPase rix7 [Coemansia javaensis]